jgi:PEP-CTERM motif
MSALSRLGWTVLLSAALSCTAARADSIDTSGFTDPATLHIGPGANTACAAGGCPIFIGGDLNGEVNNFESTGLDIYENSNGAPALMNPVLLILAIPDNTVTLTGDTIAAASLSAPYPGSPTPVSFGFGTTDYGINAGSGFAGLMSSGDVYSFLGISGADKSNSFTNWSAAELRMMGTSVTDFGIYVYTLNTGDFAGNDLLDIQLNGVPEGTFAVAFGENYDAKKIYDTPFTQAGLQDQPVEPVPEPSTLALFAGLLLALVALRARRRVQMGAPPSEL